MIKKSLLLLLITLSASCAVAQNLTEFWGMTKYGGNGGGTIFKTNRNGDSMKVMYNFIQNPGYNALYSQMCEAPNGKLYGMTSEGGTDLLGVIYEYDPQNNTYVKYFDFNGNSNGKNPSASLLLASNGKLFGMAPKGGSSNGGVLFELNLHDSTLTVKHHFTSATGMYPYGSLIEGAGGKLYGLTSDGGANSNGVIFEFDTTTAAYTKLFDFDSLTTGCNAKGGLLMASNGMLYGMCTYGGSSSWGTLFEFNPAGSVFTKKVDFTYTDNGALPNGDLIQATNGLIYGMTRQGGTNGQGVIFSFDPSTSMCTKKFDFSTTTSGNSPFGNLYQASDGKIYGMTYHGGTSGYGVLFNYDITTDAFLKLRDFNYSTGTYPKGSLVQASNGKLYGITGQGGSNNFGVVFEYNIATASYTKKIDLQLTSQGCNPAASLTWASNGKLYGMTRLGGASNYGVLFEWNPLTDTYQKLVDFNLTTNGGLPEGSLIQATDGNLYGTTTQGGSNNRGILFSYNPVSHLFSKILDFTGSANGSNPYGSLIQTSATKLYGCTSVGGTSTLGVIYQYDIITGVYTKTLNFTNSSVQGAYPMGTPFKASNGKLFGLTYYGGLNDKGALYEYNIPTASLTRRVSFGGTSGTYPYGNLVETGNGILFGLTSQGGVSGYGVLFKYDTATFSNTSLFHFDSLIYGCYPKGSLLKASNGKLYGMTNKGGSSDKGVFFEFDPSSNTLTKKLDFNSVNGKHPEFTQLIEVCTYPQLFKSPHDTALCVGESTLLTASATGNGLTYQWQVDMGSGYVDIVPSVEYSGISNDSLQLIVSSANMNNYKYRCRITSACPVLDIFSGEAVLKVPEYNFLLDTAICENQTIHWQGNDYTSSGIYTANYLSYIGCDSSYILSLIVNPEYHFSETDSICQWQPYTWHGQSLTASGIYYDNRTTLNGCDSIYTMTLTVFPSYLYSDTVSICDGQSYAWHGQSLTTAGIYYDNHTTANACDSTYTLTLNVNLQYQYTVNDTICAGDTLSWQGNDYTSAGTYNAVYTSVSGCDSLYTLNLYSHALPVVSFSGLDSMYCVYDPSATLTGVPPGGSFSGAGVSGNTFDPNAAGAGTFNIIYSYTDGNGCENKDTNTVVVDLCTEVINKGNCNLYLFPNPASTSITFFIIPQQANAEVSVFNSLGEQVMKSVVNKNETEIKLDISKLPAGMYFVKMNNFSGKFVKQ